MNKLMPGEVKKPKVAVMKNAMSRQESDAIVDGAIKRGGPFMSLADTLAHATQFQERNVPVS